MQLSPCTQTCYYFFLYVKPVLTQIYVCVIVFYEKSCFSLSQLLFLPLTLICPFILCDTFPTVNLHVKASHSFSFEFYNWYWYISIQWKVPYCVYFDVIFFYKQAKTIQNHRLVFLAKRCFADRLERIHWQYNYEFSQ